MPDQLVVPDQAPPASGPEAPAASVEKTTESKEKPADGTATKAGGVTPAPEAAINLMGFAIVFGPMLYALWRSLDWPPTVKGIALGAAIIAIALLSMRGSAYQTLRSFFVVMLIVPGAAIVCIYLASNEQTMAMKVFAVTYLSFLPPWLYLQFISSKGKTLWEEYVLNLYRLEADDYGALPEPPMSSPFWAAWEKRAQRGPPTLYTRKFEGAFGQVQSDPTARLRGENLLPVAFATVLISVGWVLVVQPESIFGFQLLPDGFSPNQRPQVPLETLRFAFLGSYFYVLQMLVRRYFQNDLKTGAYVSAITRIVIVALLVWVLELVYPADVSVAQRAAAAFVIGVFPDVGWQALLGMIKWPLKQVVPSLKQDYPLSDLDGLNLWYESRLMEEGIENMQNLTTANLVDLMLNTRVPVDRLVDWIDQATLYLHLGKPPEGESPRETLRRYGIRTATDLEEVLAGPDAEHVARVKRLLTSDGAPSVVQCVAASFQNEPNLVHVRAWRRYSAHAPPSREPPAGRILIGHVAAVDAGDAAERG